MARNAKSGRRGPAARRTDSTLRHKGEVTFQIRDEMASGGQCCPTNLVIALPMRLGGGSRAIKLTGVFSTLFQEDGETQIVSLDAWISSFQFPLPGRKNAKYQWIDTGRLQVALSNPAVCPPSPGRLGELNRGSVDYETRIVKMTWAATVQSPELYRLDIEPVPLVFQEFGFLDVETGGFRLTGSGSC